MPAAKPIWTEDRWDDGYIKVNHRGRPYFIVKRPDYPYADLRGRAKRSHVVWWLNTGQVVPDGFDMHHEDDNSLNDAFSNLKLLTHGEHSRHTNGKPRVVRICETCGKEFEALERSVELGLSKYCSHPCFANRNITDEQRKRMSDGVRAAFAETPLSVRRPYTKPPAQPPPHGMASRYNHWGCRCDLCKEAARTHRIAMGYQLPTHRGV